LLFALRTTVVAVSVVFVIVVVVVIVVIVVFDVVVDVVAVVVQELGNIGVTVVGTVVVVDLLCWISLLMWSNV